jgi:hypothetical protein
MRNMASLIRQHKDDAEVRFAARKSVWTCSLHALVHCSFQVVARLSGLPTVLQLQRVAGLTSLPTPDLVAVCKLLSQRSLSDFAFKEAFKGREMAAFTSQHEVVAVLEPKKSGKEAKEEEAKREAAAPSASRKSWTTSSPSSKSSARA